MEAELAQILIDLSDAILNLADGAAGSEKAVHSELDRARAEAWSVRDRVVKLRDGERSDG